MGKEKAAKAWGEAKYREDTILSLGNNPEARDCLRDTTFHIKGRQEESRKHRKKKGPNHGSF